MSQATEPMTERDEPLSLRRLGEDAAGATAEAMEGTSGILSTLNASGNDGVVHAPSRGVLARGRSFVVIAIIAAASGATLFAMRQIGMRGNLEQLDIKIDYTPDKSLSEDHESLIVQLQESQNVIQVPLAKLQMNPFEWKLAEERRVASGASEADILRAQLEEMERKRLETERRLDGKFQRMELTSIMGGQRPLATINGKLVREGEIVDEDFKVVLISGRVVQLEAIPNGQIYELIRE